MKIKQLRLTHGCYALGMKDNIIATDKIKIEMIGGGNFLVHHEGEIVFLPHSQVNFAKCEPDEKKSGNKA